jgi:predicted Zn-dependent peptidase
VTIRAIVALFVIAGFSRVVPPPDPLPVEQLTLPNGLRVMLAPDRSASSVAVHVRYDTGAASERAGEAGYTRLLEALLGEGSVHVDDFAARVDAVGGWATTTTTSDSLAMTDQVPAHALDLVLWLEAERMAGLADGIDEAGLAHARELVAAEYRAAFVEDPYALVPREVQRALWRGGPAGYAQPVLADVKAVDVAAIRRFARERLLPNRATVVITGGFEMPYARARVEHYFGWIPPRETTPAPRVTLEPNTSAVRTTVKDPVAKVVVAFRCEPFDPAIELLGEVLANAPSSRLVAAVVDRGLATDVRAEVTHQRAAELRLVATPAAGVDPAKVADAIHAELAKLRTHPPSGAELGRARALLGTDFYIAMENPAVRAEQLARWAGFGRGGALLGVWPHLLRRTHDVRATIARWLDGRSAVTVIGRPGGA